MVIDTIATPMHAMCPRIWTSRTVRLAMGLALLVPGGYALDNGLGRTPQMGWNSWNRFRCEGLNEHLILEVAEAMVAGLCARTPPLPRSAVTVGVSVTGIAGPGGGSPGKPVGLVWFGMSGPQGIRLERRVFAGGDRRFVRERSVETALRFLLQTVRTV